MAHTLEPEKIKLKILADIDSGEENGVIYLGEEIIGTITSAMGVPFVLDAHEFRFGKADLEDIICFIFRLERRRKAKEEGKK